MTRRPWRSAELLDVSVDAQGTSISFERSARANAVVRLRLTEITRALVRSLGRDGKAEAAANGTTVRLDYHAPLESVLPLIHRQIDVIANRPCTPRCLEQLLGIRSMERVRWTRDGRLPVAGSAAVRRGGVTSPVYWAAEIAALAARPEIVDGWRYQDAKRRDLAPSAATMSVS